MPGEDQLHVSEIQISKQPTVAAQVKYFQGYEQRKPDWVGLGRNKDAYEGSLNGLHYTMSYAQHLAQRGVNGILDIGTGKGMGFSEIMKHYGPKFSYVATGLVPYPDLPFPLHITPAETLSQFIDPKSIAVAIANYSIMYSVDPEKAVREIDKILAAGGALKAVMTNPHVRVRVDGDYELPIRTPHDFIPYFTDLGYDVFTDTSPDAEKFGHHGQPRDTLLVIKPGYPVPISAEKLYTLDRAYQNAEEDPLAAHTSGRLYQGSLKENLLTFPGSIDDLRAHLRYLRTG